MKHKTRTDLGYQKTMSSADPTKILLRSHQIRTSAIHPQRIGYVTMFSDQVIYKMKNGISHTFGESIEFIHPDYRLGYHVL